MRRRLVIDQPIERNERPKRKLGGKRSEKKSDKTPKQRAQELVDSGMPYQMAMAVVHGKMELNDALERLSRRDRVNQLMERYELSRALATQVAIGHANLELILHRRRLKKHREEYRDRTCLEPGEKLALARFGEDTVTATVQSVDAYTATLELDDGEPIEAHKLSLKYGYDPDEWKKVRKASKKDKRVANQDMTPAKQPQDRYTCSDKRLFGYVDNGREVSVTLVDGEVFRGSVQWFSRYEFGLLLKGDVEITVFRHALQDLSPS